MHACFHACLKPQIQTHSWRQVERLRCERVDKVITNCHPLLLLLLLLLRLLLLDAGPGSQRPLRCTARQLHWSTLLCSTGCPLCLCTLLRWCLSWLLLLLLKPAPAAAKEVWNVPRWLLQLCRLHCWLPLCWR